MFTVLPELILTCHTGPAPVKRSGKKERMWEANSSSFQGPNAQFHFDPFRVLL